MIQILYIFYVKNYVLTIEIRVNYMHSKKWVQDSGVSGKSAF